MQTLDFAGERASESILLASLPSSPLDLTPALNPSSLRQTPPPPSPSHLVPPSKGVRRNFQGTKKYKEKVVYLKIYEVYIIPKDHGEGVHFFTTPPPFFLLYLHPCLATAPFSSLCISSRPEFCTCESGAEHPFAKIPLGWTGQGKMRN